MQSPVNRTAGAPLSGDLNADRGLSDLALEVRELSVSEWSDDRAVEMVGASRCFLEVLSKITKVSRYREPVLITGESGVGKEQIAQALYLLSERRGRPYVSVNCPLYQEGNLTVSELFGHRKGSFTGAIADRKGAFEEADGGVIFLDEIADLHLSAQAMLLRALASGEFRPIGAERGKVADVRVIAATNRHLNELMVAQEFRNDLFFRLYYFLIRVPPLRDRGDDWRLILHKVLERLRQRYGVAKEFSTESLQLLETYTWPGNVRQLLSVATMGYAMADGDRIEPEDFASQIDVSHQHFYPGGEDPVESLYRRVVDDREDFWKVVHEPFMSRDLNRLQVKTLVKKGLEAAKGSYRDLLDVFHLRVTDYQKLMDFLRHQNLKP